MALANSSLEIVTLNTGLNDFSIALYKELQKTEGNIFFSPFSIQFVLFLASIGARGNTYDEIMNTIILPIHQNDELNQLYKNLLISIKVNKYLKLSTGLFLESSLDIDSNFTDTAKKYFDSTVEKIDFKSDPEKGRHSINQWISDHTQGRINELFDSGSITSDTKLLLGNAILFNGEWNTKFEKDLIKEQPFYLTLNETINIKMMNIINTFFYYKDSNFNFSALSMFYKGMKFRIIILLPDAKNGISELESNLSNINVSNLKFKTHNVTVTLPKFKIVFNSELKDTLSKMGCPTMFSSKANLTGISNYEKLSISNVLHKANIEVTEEGTDATAASGLLVSNRIRSPKQQAVFLADHPFIFFIKYESTTLFMGRFIKP